MSSVRFPNIKVPFVSFTFTNFTQKKTETHREFTLVTLYHVTRDTVGRLQDRVRDPGGESD